MPGRPRACTRRQQAEVLALIAERAPAQGQLDGVSYSRRPPLDWSGADMWSVQHPAQLWPHSRLGSHSLSAALGSARHLLSARNRGSAALISATADFLARDNAPHSLFANHSLYALQGALLCLSLQHFYGRLLFRPSRQLSPSSYVKCQMVQMVQLLCSRCRPAPLRSRDHLTV